MATEKKTAKKSTSASHPRKSTVAGIRPIWKGYVTFGLVNIPVILYPAEKRFDIHFKLVDSRDKAKIHYVRVNENTGQEVPWNNVAKAYEYEKNNYVVVKESDIKEIMGDQSKEITINNFINKNCLEPIDYEKPYYLVPDTRGAKGYVILREILKKTNKVGICKVVIHTREYLAALLPSENALVLNLLRYHQELRKSSEFELPENNLKTYHVTPKELEIASQLVTSMSSKWNPEDYHDEFREALQEWIEEKILRETKKIPHKKTTSTEKHATNVVNFVDLLKKSLAKTKSSKIKPKTIAKRKSQAKR